jgi:hypothetical protein
MRVVTLAATDIANNQPIDGLWAIGSERRKRYE